MELHDNFIDFLSRRESDTVDGQNAVTDGAVHGMQTAAGPARAESGSGLDWACAGIRLSFYIVHD